MRPKSRKVSALIQCEARLAVLEARRKVCRACQVRLDRLSRQIGILLTEIARRRSALTGGQRAEYSRQRNAAERGGAG